MAMTLVSTVTVGSGGAASIEFTNIPQTGKDLLLVFSGRSELYSSMTLSFNSSTSNFSYRDLQGSGSSVSSSSRSDSQYLVLDVQDSWTANTFGNVQLYISNYGSSANKSWSIDAVIENNGTEAYQTLVAGLWSNSAAVTAVKLQQTSVSDIAQYSTASLYIIS